MCNAGHSNCTLVSDLVKNTTTCLDRLIPSDRKPGELSRNKCFNYHPHPEPLIVGIGGSPSLSQEFRHMAAIGYGDEKDIQWLCGGSLISKRFILTAAHCLSSKIGEAKYVRLGDLDISTDKDDAQPQNFTILKRIPHPSFKPSETYHDIALLHLDREPLFTAYVSPACLNTRRDLPIFNDEMTATGWGKVGFSGESSNILIKVRLDYVPYDKCVQSFMKKNGRLYTSLLSNGIVDDLQICAGGVIGVDTCQGDSGGPLQLCLSEYSECLEYYPTPEFLTDHIIAGGELSLVKEFPHMAAIGYGKETNVEWKCGGSLISKKFVLTAAHCVAHETEKPTFVRLGDLNLTSTEDNTSPQNFTVVRIIPHPSYAPPVKYHDIALLELDREVEFTDYVKPACLYTEKYRGETTMTATGWGKTGFSEESSSFLLKVSLDFVPHNECLTAFKKYSKRSLPNGIIEDTQICAGRVKGKDTCQGDSGGPLQVINGDRTQVQPSKVYDIIGVTSFGKACALSAAPGIYTRVSYYVPWIESIAFQNES
ncbi:hypothetical protein NQ315_008535 [Exocentrus adspersus]|uniref:Peptidase S1 domain-containing protein n=1 Tax=Exocentrus adspersus TaxID=1586481 RepID=A0AAV8W5L5_9CUCU|nr:hypothetical protein NQ315_008535 [Exocentrus adspersus]